MKNKTSKVLIILGFVLLTIGHYWGLFVAPKEQYMGDIGRILYAHVPVALIGLLGCTLTFIFSLGYLLSSNYKYDDLTVGSAEGAALLSALTLITGSIWGKPTWGVWWAWDPRLTSMLILFISFVGLLIFRSYIDDPEKKATWSSVYALIASINVPITYMSVKWWNTLHQVQSNVNTVNNKMLIPFRLSILAVCLIYIGFMLFRAQIESHQRQKALNPDY